MSRNQFSRTLTVAFAIGLLTAGAIVAQGPITTNPGAAQIEWQAGVEGALVLSVSGPGDFHMQQRFAPGEAAVFSVFDETGDVRPSGGYTFEVRLEPVLDAQTRGELEAAREAGEGAGTLRKAGKIPSEPIVHSGYFAIEGGAVVLGGDEEPVADKPSGDGGARLAAKDQVILDDLIVDGSACIGFDCVNGESFGFDTLRLKENNLRIKFQDTSTAGSFPTNDWQITANDSASGGANKFSIDDIDGGRTPFTIEASAPSHSLYVDDGGRVGFGTSTPVVELHVKDGDSPTLRLEQDGSSGFAPQTWDVAGNETNFFVRDASNGSQLPFRIRPSAPTNSIFIDNDGDVGLGTASPDGDLDVVQTNGTVGFRLQRAGDPVTMLFEDTSAGQEWEFKINAGGDFAINDPSVAGGEFILGSDGDLTISGDFFSATCTSPGSPCAPDYVFEPDYELMPLAELKAFVETNRHLPNVPSESELRQARQINLSKFQLTLLEKIEEITLYTLDQQEEIAELRRENDELKNRLEAVEGLAGQERD